jgi:hypothetical protein
MSDLLKAMKGAQRWLVRPTRPRNECEELVSVGQETNTNNEYEESHDLQGATSNMIPALNLGGIGTRKLSSGLSFHSIERAKSFRETKNKNFLFKMN